MTLSEPAEAWTPELCYRCNHRARFLETMKQKFPNRPRMQCGDIEKAVFSCYNYVPVVPVVLLKDAGDSRPAFGPSMISARMHPTRLAEGRLLTAITARDKKLKVAPSGTDGDVLYWDFAGERLDSNLTMWLPLRYRIHVAFRLSLMKTDIRSLPVRMIFRAYYTIINAKDQVFDWIADKRRIHSEGTNEEDLNGHTESDDDLPGSDQESR